MLDRAMDTRFAFYDRLLQFDEVKTFQHFDFERTQKENAAASAKGIELLKKSPYKDQLGTAEAFIADLQKLSREIPNLISPRLGDFGILKLPVAGTENETAARHIVALPLGGRVKMDPWNDTLALLKSQPVSTITEREKMPFEITPFVIYLTRVGSENPKISQPTLARQSALEPGSKSTTANAPSPQAENAPPPGPGSVAAQLKETIVTTPPSANVNQLDGARAASTAEPESSLPPKPADSPGDVKPSVSVSFSFYPSILVPAGLEPQTSGQGTTLQVGQLLSRVDPVYPEEAEKQQMEGTVELHSIIGQDGTVQSVEPRSGPALLVAAAANAVRKWRYTPSSVGGQPVEAEEDITVTFRLLKQTTHPN
jgi:TonB family protein